MKQNNFRNTPAIKWSLITEVDGSGAIAPEARQIYLAWLVRSSDFRSRTHGGCTRRRSSGRRGRLQQGGQGLHELGGPGAVDLAMV